MGINSFRLQRPEDGLGDASGGQPTSNPAGNPKGSENQADEKPSFVPRDAYERIQGDLVKWKNRARDYEAKVGEFESNMRAEEERKALDEKRYKELLDKKQQEHEQLMQRYSHLEQNWTNAQKYSTVSRFLGSDFDSKYANLIPFEKIELTEDGSIDPDSAKAVADEFKQEHPRLFMNPKKNVPGDYPGGVSPKMSPREFQSLGRSKDMLANIDKVFPELNRKE